MYLGTKPGIFLAIPIRILARRFLKLGSNCRILTSDSASALANPIPILQIFSDSVSNLSDSIF